MAETTTNVYEFLLMRAKEGDKNLPNITDFHYIAFIRNPVLKQATYIDMQAQVPITTLTVIDAEINNGKFPQYELCCYQIKDIDKSDDNAENRQKLFYTTFVNIISISEQKDTSSTARPQAESTIPVRMLLVNPIAWQMNINTGFNKVFERKIALDTINEFAEYMIKKYGASAKNIKKFELADKNTVNLIPYPQITIPPTLPEINIPEYIIHTYKSHSTPCLWFFDTFNFGDYDKASAPENGKIPIWCLLINFFNCANTFKKIDISKDVDIPMLTHLIGTAKFTDTRGILNRPNPMVNFYGPNMTQVLKKLGSLPQTQKTDVSYQTESARHTSLKVYYPDSQDNAEKRLVDCVSLFSEHIDRIEYYETANTSPDWLQFGKLYNIEYSLKIDNNPKINENKYIHTPLVILNIFKRRQAKDNLLECINKYAMLRLVEQKGSASGSSNAPKEDPIKGSLKPN